MFLLSYQEKMVQDLTVSACRPIREVFGLNIGQETEHKQNFTKKKIYKILFPSVGHA
jgi:hypothetical protein